MPTLPSSLKDLRNLFPHTCWLWPSLEAMWCHTYLQHRAFTRAVGRCLCTSPNYNLNISRAMNQISVFKMATKLTNWTVLATGGQQSIQIARQQCAVNVVFCLNATLPGIIQTVSPVFGTWSSNKRCCVSKLWTRPSRTFRSGLEPNV